MEQVLFKDLGIIDYKVAWDYQEVLLQENLKIKSELRQLAMAEGKAESREQKAESGEQKAESNDQRSTFNDQPTTTHHLLFCEHPPVYTLGKSGSMDNVLMSEQELEDNHIQFFNTNRGGDITFHGLQQIVGYPILDLEKFYTDIGKYLRNLEEVIILTIAEYGIKGERSSGETGVWIEPGVMGKERKICAMGVRCSRWVTMHGFALNVNTDLSFFNNIIPCGIQNKQVTSIERELGHTVDYEEAKEKVRRNFEKVFAVEIRN